VTKAFPQVVVTRYTSSGRHDCEGFDEVPAINPAAIVLIATSPAAELLLEKLRAELVRVLRDAGAVSVPAHCNPAVWNDPDQCKTSDEQGRHRAVVLVGDPAAAIDGAHVPHVDPKDPIRSVIPVFPRSSKTGVTGLLPPAAAIWNAEFYATDIAETAPAILARAGLTIERPRVFISYRQGESSDVAVQLFDELSHRNCDVFLDSFRIEAGVDFQARLTEQLGDKSLFLLLESATTLKSKWVRYEIAKATALGIGRVAVQLPGGKKARQIVDALREKLEDADCVSDGKIRAGRPVLELTADALARVTQRVLREHVRALFVRRGALHASMREALANCGVARSEFDHFGALHVYREPDATAEDYLVWLSASPPGLPEFFRAYREGDPPPKRVVIGPAETLSVLRHQYTGWLSSRSGAIFEDEGRLKSAARRIARGSL
jgi:hypothetical protein